MEDIIVFVINLSILLIYTGSIYLVVSKVSLKGIELSAKLYFGMYACCFALRFLLETFVLIYSMMGEARNNRVHLEIIKVIKNFVDISLLFMIFRFILQMEEVMIKVNSQTPQEF